MLSVLFVYYNTKIFLKECIESIIENKGELEFEIIIVNNGSSNDDESFFKNLYPRIKWIDMNYNSGFARANNAGLKIARGDAVLLLNTDTLIKDDVLNKCYQRLLRSTDLVAAGVNLKFESGAAQISGSYFIKGGLNYLLPLPVIGFLLKKSAKLLGKSAPHVINNSSNTDVDWISGAFLMVKMEAINSVGMMDEDFFLYAEETEWCSRLGKQGKLVLFGDLSIIHYEGLSSKEDHPDQEKGYYELHSKRGLQLIVSNILRIRKQYGIFWYLIILLMYNLEIVFSFIIGLLYLLTGSAQRIRKSIGFAKNIIILWKLFPEMLFNRPHFYKMM